MELTDEQFIEQRRTEDERNYLLNITDPDVAPRLAPAMQKIREALIEAGANGLSWAAVCATGLRVTDVQVKTVDSALRKLIKHGFVVKQGEYERAFNRKTRRWSGSDTRRCFVGEWPDPGTTR